MMSLTLPRIDARIPRTVLPAQMIQSLAALPQYLMDAEAFSEADIPQSWESTFDACQAAMQSWIQREIGQLHCLEPSFHMGLSPAGEDVPFSDASVVVEWLNNGGGQFSIGEKLEALNALIPGLGVIVLHVLSHQASQAYPLFLPDVALETASFLYWFGHDDESLALEEICGEDEEEREAMLEGMVRLADFKEAIPAWALGWPRGLTLKYCSRYLRRCLKKLDDPPAAQIAADALALSLLQFSTDYSRELEGTDICHACVLSWTVNDVTSYVHEALWERATESEYRTLIGAVELPADEPKLFHEWQQDMRPRFEAIRLIDRLIAALSM